MSFNGTYVYDFIFCGGSFAAAGAAVRLADEGKRVLLLESARAPAANTRLHTAAGRSRATPQPPVPQSCAASCAVSEPSRQTDGSTTRCCLPRSAAYLCAAATGYLSFRPPFRCRLRRLWTAGGYALSRTACVTRQKPVGCRVTVDGDGGDVTVTFSFDAAANMCTARRAVRSYVTGGSFAASGLRLAALADEFAVESDEESVFYGDGYARLAPCALPTRCRHTATAFFLRSASTGRPAEERRV